MNILSSVEGLVTLQERMVNLVNQMTIPVVEVAIVIESHINQSYQIDRILTKKFNPTIIKDNTKMEIDIENTAYSNSNF